jgi:hypothetical protein
MNTVAASAQDKIRNNGLIFLSFEFLREVRTNAEAPSLWQVRLKVRLKVRVSIWQVRLKVRLKQERLNMIMTSKIKAWYHT